MSKHRQPRRERRTTRPETPLDNKPFFKESPDSRPLSGRQRTPADAAFAAGQADNRTCGRDHLGSEDPLLRDPCRAHAHELAYLRADEPRRIVVPVAAARPVDEHDVVAAE